LPLEQNHKVEKKRKRVVLMGYFDVFNNLQTNEENWHSIHKYLKAPPT
jgi:hypothetical protein